MYAVRRVVIPHGGVKSHNGWFSIVRGAMITRRQALRVLLLGPVRARVEHLQSEDPEALPV